LTLEIFYALDSIDHFCLFQKALGPGAQHAFKAKTFLT